MSVYKLKSAFQNVLRPLVAKLAAIGVTANQVTVLAAAVSVVLGAALTWSADPRWFALIPLWMLLRMALNAMDGMLAREHGQQSRLGAFLNELGDVVSDAALYMPFAVISPFTPEWISAIIFLSVVTEFAGVLGSAQGGPRRYDGPLGKSDRAVLFGALGLLVAAELLAPWAYYLQPVVCLALIMTTINRVRAGIGLSG
ncbi:CDP-alcohol phosphatidyltransferase family protein [Sinorhizobium sp. BG8]|uniref:CDP-alcohol phosphatidyltransferase family protein n=1 Tax=Sinorhizobium sp. BG8 TaxID=2613773 RepID=UPI00193CD36B|nr:CDP-alcohol phosphatidyltransferase family protein [Sinorhizobium sp. BG8]QRM57412.1 CDP-alcohol phosphatidyltransferase family protein [Sinorhizobium sp. BG8]